MMANIQHYFVVIFGIAILIFVAESPFEMKCIANTKVAEIENHYVVLDVLSAEPKSCESLGKRIVFRGPLKEGQEYPEIAGEGPDDVCKQHSEWKDNSVGFTTYEKGMNLKLSYERVDESRPQDSAKVCRVLWKELS